jgi:hypothetical protein
MNSNVFIKYILLILFFITTSNPSKAQIYLGGKMGFQLSKHNFFDEDFKKSNNIGFLPGFNIGLATNLKISNSFDLYNEINYSTKGTRISNYTVHVKDKLQLSYLDFPFLLRTSIYKDPYCKVFLQMGPTIGFWLKGKGLIQSDELLEEGFFKLKYDFKFNENTPHIMHGVTVPEPNRTQLSLNVGIGTEMTLRSKHVFLVDLRYEMGHTYLSKSDEMRYYIHGYAHNYKANNQVFMISTAYLLNMQTVRRQLMK